MIEEIQHCACYNFTTSTPKVLEKKRGHTVGTRGFQEVHLLQGHSNFLCRVSSDQIIIHSNCNFQLDCM